MGVIFVIENTGAFYIDIIIRRIYRRLLHIRIFITGCNGVKMRVFGRYLLCIS